MGFHHAEFVAYRRRLLSEGKPPLVATIAVGHRAHRLAFSLMRSGTPYDPIRWVRSVAEGDGQARHGDTPPGPASDDVTCPASDAIGAQEAEGK
ncbi:hypothetical protein [Streptomyces sp. LN590]